MDQQLSRPARWRSAVNRGINAVSGLRELRTEWASKLEELVEELSNLREQRASKKEVLSDALTDLINLQRDYDCWTVPENLADSRLQHKLYDVQSFSFQARLNDIPDLTKFALEDVLERALMDALDPNSDLVQDDMETTLHSAKECDLPKGFGRD